MKNKSTEWNKEAHAHVIGALRSMLATEPFYAHLAFNLPWVQVPLKGDLISTDGVSVRYDPEKVMSLMASSLTEIQILTRGKDYTPILKAEFSDVILRNLLAATLTRIALRHPFRAERWGMKEEQKQVIASDSTIYNIVKASFGYFPSQANDNQISDSDTMVFEQIYDRVKLPPKPPQPEGGAGMTQPGQGSGEGSQPHSAFGNPMPGEGDNPAQGDLGEAEEDIKQAVEKAASRAREAGKMSPNLLAQLMKVGESKKDWREDLRIFLGGGEIPQQSWSKPNRRFIADDIYLPGNPKEGPGKVVLFIDTSGSVDDKLLSTYIAEVEKINVDLQPEEIWVVATDTRVQWVGNFSPYEQVTCKPLGRGGTDFTAAHKWLEASGINPKAVVWFTDLEVHNFGPQPPCETLWVVWPNGSTKAPPWGRRIDMV